MFEYFSVDTEPSAFQLDHGADFKSIVALWQSKRPGNGLPAWSDFSLADFSGWHERMAVSEILPSRNLICPMWAGDESPTNPCSLTGSGVFISDTKTYTNMCQAQDKKNAPKEANSIGALSCRSRSPHRTITRLLSICCKNTTFVMKFDGVTVPDSEKACLNLGSRCHNPAP